LLFANDYEYFLKIICNGVSVICKFIVSLHSKLEMANQKKMNDIIKHTGIIDSIEGNHLRVRIMQTSACASCKVARQCHTSEMKEKLIDVFTDARPYAPGQEVTVMTSKSMANRALALGFGIPFFMMLAVLFIMYHFTKDEATSALAAIGALLPYYLIIWLLRDSISQKISFQIERQQTMTSPTE